MITRIGATLVGSAVLALGCVDLEAPRRESLAAAESGVSSSPFGFLEGGSIPYVLGYSRDTGQVLGGAHTLLIPLGGRREAIDAGNLPWSLHPDLQGSYLFLNSQLTQGESEAGAFASNWWPQRQNGIADRWNSTNKNYADLTSDPENLSPAEKYDLLFYSRQQRTIGETTNWTVDDMNRPEGLRSAPNVHRALTVAGPTTSWELQHHGVYQGVYPEYWWGHCNGWSAYVTAETGGPPRRDVRVKLEGGAVAECAQGEEGCVFFRMADIEALMSELYYVDSVTSSGRRCEMREDRFQRDIYGRPADAACRDSNPGTMHVAMTGMLGLGTKPIGDASGPRQKRSFVVDYTWHREVWSFPVKKFSIDALEEVSAQQAARLVCAGAYQGADCYNYRLNPSARRFVRVAARYWMISDQMTGATLLLPPAQRDVEPTVSELHYVLELDDQLKVLGGEWIQNPSIVNGVNGKEMHPDFLWLPVKAQGAGEDADDLGGSGDNPYIAYSKVKALLSLSRSGS
jgi:hypothetical protein